MSDLLTQRLASSKGRARVRMSDAERVTVQSARAASVAALAGARERAAVAHYERTVTRMSSLMTERTYLTETLNRHREDGCWTSCDNPVHESLRVNGVELDGVFSTPIRQTDTAPGGRFERMVSYHMRRIASRITIGSTLITGDDSRDIVSLAIVRAYSESALVEDERGHLVPTLGTMYRFARAELMRTVSRARREVSTVSRDAEWYSPREEVPRNGADSLYGVDPARIDWEDASRAKSILTPAPRWSVTPDADEQALAERVERRRTNRARAEALAHASARKQDRVESAERAAYGDDDSLGIDAACASLLASGTTIPELADRLGVLPTTVERRLSNVRIVTVGGSIVARRPSPRRKSVTVSRELTTDVVVTRKRAPRTVRVIDWDTIPEGWRNAPTPTPVHHYTAEEVAAVKEWACECGMTNVTSEWATLSYHLLDTEHDQRVNAYAAA